MVAIEYLTKSLKTNRVQLSMLREDEVHPVISGNKYRKLHYNIIQAKTQGFKTILSFGGAYSNHIHALASAGSYYDLKTIGVIRGDELTTRWQENPSLAQAAQHGMQFHFVDRATYRKKESPSFLEHLKTLFGPFYLLPEGGTNPLAVKGCKEILNKTTHDFDIICLPVGTGGTIAGVIESSQSYQKVMGFSALKGIFQNEIIQQYTQKNNYQLVDTYCFGGYGKIDVHLVRFINEFKQRTQIALDPIYTGKMMFGILKMIQQNTFQPNTRILAIHTGGLQGIAGMNQLLKKKNLPQIEI